MTFRKISRRTVIAAGAAAAAASFGSRWYSAPSLPEVPTVIRGAAAKKGHLIKDRTFPAISDSRRSGIVIVGGGISGLSAAWRLSKRGYTDFELLELEDHAGGNSQSGENEVSAYPWGAHYVPLPGAEAEYVMEFFEDIGIIVGRDAAGLPIYDEFALCAAPQERLLIEGRWQEGMLPEVTASKSDKADYKKFFDFIREMKTARGADGRFAFSIPSALSSADPKFRRYDELSMEQLLAELGVTSANLRWYLNYCYRDDFGVPMDRVSAWAGIHYFAARRFEASGIKESTLVTWPEGNGYLVKRLLERVGSSVRTSLLVFNIKNVPDGASVQYLDLKTGTAHEILARGVIYAAPRFTAHHVIEELRSEPPGYLPSLQYAPWMVANITLGRSPDLKHLDSFAWDNVFFGGESLGYVVATHQSLKRGNGETVLTYYLPLSAKDPAEERKRALAATPEEWRERILRELLLFQPALGPRIKRIDVWLWGHAMREPRPGSVWGPVRDELEKPIGAIRFAHSDMSGFSIFEEAQYHGVTAADLLLAAV